ncbi:MAG: hypothetical protein JHC84_17810 [Solirubrobacteraceae bacterium]|nr:hypothetical protein [Solirubrobacteraceae bacterium]
MAVLACALALSACGADDAPPDRAEPGPPATAVAEEPRPAPARAEFFAADSIWNEPLPDDAPLDPRSDALVERLRRLASDHGTTVNIREFSTPLYRVGRDQPTVRVQLDEARAPELQRAIDAVPLPRDARPAAGTDANLVVYQESTDTSWEFWRFRREADGFHAGWAGKMVGVRENPGWFRDRTDPFERRFWGITATNIAKLAGLVTLEDLRRGRIDHVLAVAIPEARRDVWSRPAQNTDGVSDDPGAIPEGARFRLDPKLDLDTLELPRFTRILAEAAQRHGIVINNTAGAVVFHAQDPRPGDGNPYPDLLDGLVPAQVARAFPYEHLQALELRLERRR